MSAQSFTFDRGQDFVAEFTAASGGDISGWSLAFYLYWQPGDDPILVRTTDPGGGLTVTDGPGGKFQLHLPASITGSVDLVAGIYQWEVWRTDGGSEGKVASGSCEAVGGVTLPAGPPLPTPSDPPLVVARGGTGATAFTAGSLLGGNGTAAIQSVTVGSGLDLTGNTLTATAAPATTGNTLWVDAVNGSDATGTRGRQDKPYLTLTAAKAAALAGDLIQVRPGTYTAAAALTANGVGWAFDPGAAVTRSDVVFAGGNGGLADDGPNGTAAAVVGSIVGDADFVRTAPLPFGGTFAVVNIENPGSDLTVRARSLRVEPSTGTGNVVKCAAGSLRVESGLIGNTGVTSEPTIGVLWSGGDLHVRADEIVIGSTVGGAGVHCNIVSAPTGSAYIEADEIAGPTDGILQLGSDATAVMRVRALLVRSTTGAGDAVGVAGSNQLDVQTQTLIGRVTLQSGSALTLIAAVRWEANADGTSGQPALLMQTAATGRTVLDIGDADPAGHTGDMFRVVGGGTVEIRGMRYTANAGSKGFEVTGGTVRLVNCRIDTSANAATNPITISGGTVELVNCTLIAAAGRDSISASTPQTVAVAGTLTANTAPNVNVTLSGGALVRSDTGMLAPSANLSLTSTAGGVSETTPTAGVYLAHIGGSYRILLANGTGANNFQIDNSGDGFRFLFPGQVFFSGSKSLNVMAFGGDFLVGTPVPEATNSRLWVRDNDGSRPVLRVTRDATSATPAHIVLELMSSTSTRRPAAETVAEWADPTDASRRGRRKERVYNGATPQTGTTTEADPAGVKQGFFGGAAVAKPTVTGSRGGNAALQSLLTQLASLGLITDSTTA